MPAIFSDGMVLQREAQVRVWGWCDPGEPVAVTASWPGGSTWRAEADREGRFEVAFDTQQAGGPFELTVRAGSNPEHVIDDVWLGEVWICSGQSNMEWTLGPGVGPGIQDWKREVLSADYPELRLFNVPNHFAASPADDCEARWMRCTPETATTFSATAYFFGRELARNLDCPIALVETDWGGTVCEAWTSHEALAAFPEFKDDLKTVAKFGMNPWKVEQELARATEAWWKGLGEKDPGSGEARFMNASFSDKGWGAMPVPGGWEGAVESLARFDGIVWFRRSFELSGNELDHEYTLELGTIDDMDTTWVNGQKVGGLETYGSWNKKRSYAIPAGVLKKGRNVIAVRVLDTGGAGGIHGESDSLALKASDGTELSLAGSWRYQAGADIRTVGRPPSRAWLHQNRATALFNGMLSPLIPLSVCGVIWYQGESNRPRWEQYRRLFPAMIVDWRQQFQNADMPFYFVQIAPFNYGGDTGEAALLRDAQRRTLALPNTGMAVTMDIGDPRNIHPANKQDVGRRLALWALAKDYGKAELEYSGPLAASVKRSGASVRVRFTHADGLTTRGAPLELFTLAGSDGRYHPAMAKIDGDTIVVQSNAVSEPKSVRFGGGAGDETSLWNAAGLPASSFVLDIP